MNDPTVNLTLVAGSAGLIGCGVYLLLERSLSRALVGLVMASNGVALAFMVASGPAGKAPIMTDGVEQSDISDPLPQAMVLTATLPRWQAPAPAPSWPAGGCVARGCARTARRPPPRPAASAPTRHVQRLHRPTPGHRGCA